MIKFLKDIAEVMEHSEKDQSQSEMQLTTMFLVKMCF